MQAGHHHAPTLGKARKIGEQIGSDRGRRPREAGLGIDGARRAGEAVAGRLRDDRRPVAAPDVDARHDRVADDDVEGRARGAAPAWQNLAAIADVDHAVEAPRERSQPRQRFLSCGIHDPQHGMHSMHHQTPSLRPPGSFRVEVHRV